MQTATASPAENLLLRLLQSNKIQSTYAVSLEKSEGHTSLYVRLISAEPISTCMKTHE
jgi:hypothetical protein